MQKRIAVQLSIKLLLKKSYSRKGNNLVYLKINSIFFIVELNRKGRALFTFVYISLEAEELLSKNIFECFIMYFNENSTKTSLCNTQYRSSYYNGIAFL